ncbi:MAG: phosphoglycerate dehydrogenase [Alphaproteobacteria bacterium]|nr:phosphoglycerate dehydrogenase [Alphaproteobacteria bacterium]
MPKVLISDELSPRAVDIFKARGLEVDVKTGLKPDQLRAIVGAYDGLAIRSATKVTREVLEVATNLKVVGRAGIGVDNVDIKTATQKGVVVMNTPYGNAITTAEHAIALMFALAREIPAADRSTRAGKWEKNRFMGVELSGKTLGILGCGNIGSIVADRALGLKMKVIAFDPFLTEDRAKALGIDKVELDELFERADFISLHAPLTESTKNVIDAKALFKMKKGVRIINCARGGLIVEEDLKTAIESGHVAGAALDVFLAEPAKDNPLFGLEQVIATPHLGASTTEAQEKVALQIAEQMSDFLLTGAVTNALNMPSVSAEEAPKLKPYMRLAELLGSMLGQVVEREVTAVTLELEGHAAELNPRPMVQAALAGLFRPMLDSVNMVNAPEIARQRNIAVSETRHERDCDYQTLLRLTVVTEARSRSADGTLIGGTRPRLVAVQDIAIEADFGKHLLYVRNKDKPGFIGAIGTVLGSAGINIATFHLGRTEPGKDALCLIEFDQPIPDEVLEKVKGLQQVERVRTLSF